MSAADNLACAERITGALDSLLAGAHELSDDVGDAVAEIHAANRRGDLRGRLDSVCHILRFAEKARKELEGALADAMHEAYHLSEDLADEEAEEDERERWALLREYWAGVRM